LSGRTPWRIVVPLGIVIGVALTLTLWSLDGGGSEDNRGRSPAAPSGARTLRAGASIDADALWLFGFDTVRVDPATLHGARRLGQPAFGESAGSGNRVFFYDPGSGQVGRLDAATSRFQKAQPVSSWAAPGGGGHVAARGTVAWIVTGPTTVDRIDAATLADAGAVAIDAPGATDTWVAAGPDRVLAASPIGTTVVLRALDPAAPAVRITPDAAPGTPVGLARGNTTTWIVQARGATAFPDGGAPVPVVLPAAAGPVRAAAARGRDLWVLADDGAALYRLQSDAPGAVDRVAILHEPPATFRAPVAVVADSDAVWVLAPTRPEPDRHDAVVVRVDARSAKVTKSLTIPSDLFVGAIARTH
jgi:hypothetical protein